MADDLLGRLTDETRRRIAENRAAGGLPPRPSAVDVEDALLAAGAGVRSAVDLDTLAREVLHLRARVAELDAERGEPTGTEWGVRWPDDGDVVEEWGTDEDDARRVVAAEPHLGGVLVKATRGPWVQVQP